MATEATVLVASVEKKDSGWYELTDGNGLKYSTKKQSVFEPAYKLVDQQAKLTFVEKVNGNFTNRYLDAVEAVAQENGNPNPGDGSYIKGQTNPADKQSIHRSVALKAAVDTMSHTVATSATPKAAYMKVVPLADAYVKWLEGTPAVEVGTLPAGDEDIPF